jgi:hypothetical protein
VRWRRGRRLHAGHRGAPQTAYPGAYLVALRRGLHSIGMGGVPDMQNTTVYPLTKAEDPPANQWVNWTELDFNTVHANDVRFYEEVDDLIQEEPTEALDPERAGQLAAIGLVKGQPFAPTTACAGSWTRRPASAPAGPCPFLRPPGPAGVAARLLEERLCRRQLRVLAQRGPAAGRPHQFHDIATVIIPPCARRPGPAGQELLGRGRLRHPDPLAHPDPLDHLAGPAQQHRPAPGQPRRLLRPVLRPHRARG